MDTSQSFLVFGFDTSTHGEMQAQVDGALDWLEAASIAMGDWEPGPCQFLGVVPAINMLSGQPQRVLGTWENLPPEWPQWSAASAFGPQTGYTVLGWDSAASETVVGYYDAAAREDGWVHVGYTWLQHWAQEEPRNKHLVCVLEGYALFGPENLWVWQRYQQMLRDSERTARRAGGRRIIA